MKKLLYLGTLALALIITSCEKEDVKPVKQERQPTEIVDASNARQKDPPKYWQKILFDQGKEWSDAKKLATAVWVAGGGKGQGAPPGQGLEEFFYDNVNDLMPLLDISDINGVIDGTLTATGLGDHTLPVGSTYQLSILDMSGEVVSIYDFQVVPN